MNTKQLRQKILDLAIRGKLVPNESITNDELRMTKSALAKEDMPFEIPENWKWARGHQCFKPMESKKPTGEKFRYIDINSIDNKKHIITEPRWIDVSDAPSRASRSIDVGDTIFSMVRPYLENIAYIDENYNDCIASTTRDALNLKIFSTFAAI